MDAEEMEWLGPLLEKAIDVVEARKPTMGAFLVETYPSPMHALLALRLAVRTLEDSLRAAGVQVEVIDKFVSMKKVQVDE